MAYIGKNLVGVLNESRTVDTMTGDNSTTTLALSRTPGSMNNVLVFIDGIRQTPDTDYTLSGSTLTFTTAPETGVSVSVISGNDTPIVPDKGSVSATKLVDGSITDSKIVGMSASKLSGALPALDGSALTGFSSYTVIAADPTITTNPAGGVGSLYVNSTSGEVYICTDATTDNNIWTNVGGGTGDIAPFHFTGSTYGFVAGGQDTGGNEVNVIQKFSFTTQSDSTDHGDLSVVRYWNSGASSSTHGYSQGDGSATSIDKFAFTSNVTAVTHGDIPTQSYGGARSQTGGHSSETHGFVSGGGGDKDEDQDIFKYSFASNVTAASHGDLAGHQKDFAGMSGPTDGFTSGGWMGADITARIDKFAYASNVTATSHGNLSHTWRYGANCSSATDGFVCGDLSQGWMTAEIEKISWASNVTAASHGNLSVARAKSIGQSETTQGFVAGGDTGNPSNVIDKFSYASNTTGTDHSDLYFMIKYRGSGHQV